MNTPRTLVILCGLAVLCVGCAPLTVKPQPIPSQPTTGTAVTVPMAETGEQADTNEVMPKTTDSLEVGTASGVIAVTTEVTDRWTARTGCGTTVPVLTEYFDYDCEYCREHALTDRPWLEQRYVATGKLTIERVFVPETPWGMSLVTAALCAGKQGKYGEIDEAFTVNPPSTEAGILALAKKLKLRSATFIQCRKNPAMSTALTGSGTEAIGRVPAFKLGNETWEGVMTEEELRGKIEELLRRK